jgi:hypothetical protein
MRVAYIDAMRHHRVQEAVMQQLKWIFATLLALAATAQAADWELVVSAQDESVFVDRASIHSDGTLKKAWVLRNYSRVHTLGDTGFPHKSKVILYAFQCDQDAFGYSQWSFQSGELGSGRTVWADHVKETTFTEAALDPAIAQVLGEVCRS